MKSKLNATYSALPVMAATVHIFALSACDSGGGGGGTTTTGIATADIVEAESEVTSSGRFSGLTASVGSDDVEYRVAGHRFYVNGVEPEGWEFVTTEVVKEGGALGAAFGTYLDEDGNSRSFATRINYRDIAKFTHNGRFNYSWSSVPYSYAVGNPGKEASIYDGVGTIDVGVLDWNAKFGSVELTGSRSGVSDVEGTARLGDITGTFEGVEGVWHYGGKEYHLSHGAFAGDGGSSSSFAGVWETGAIR